MKIPDCTLTTCCYNLSSFHSKARPLNESINNTKELLNTPCYLVIYADKDCMPSIKEFRNAAGYENLTYYVEMEFNELPKYILLDMVKQNREISWPTRDERTCAEAHILNCSKFDLTLKTMELNPFNTSKFGWIDSSLGSDKLRICQNYENNSLLYALNNLTDKFQIQILNVNDKKYKNKEFKKEYYDRYRYVVCGGLFTTSKNIGIKIFNRCNELIEQTVEMGFGHGEEMVFLEILDEFYDDIQKSYGDYHFIINNFVRPTYGFDYINNFIIKGYLNLSYHKECYDCCKVVLNEIESFHVKINYDVYFSILFSYYISTFYHKGKEEAKTIVNHITKLIELNPNIKREFEKNENFFKNNFKMSFD